jgi:hypothetical protein
VRAATASREAVPALAHTLQAERERVAELEALVLSVPVVSGIDGVLVTEHCPDAEHGGPWLNAIAAEQARIAARGEQSNA